jgi:hypothetical protein
VAMFASTFRWLQRKRYQYEVCPFASFEFGI